MTPSIPTDLAEDPDWGELAERRELLDIRRALNQSAIVAATDQTGRITYVNEKFCEISKYSAAELVGQDHRIINSGYHPKSFIRDLWRTIAQGGIWRGDLRNRAKDGSVYWVSTTIVPFLNQEGKPTQYLAIRFDITERKRAEENLSARTKELEAIRDQLLESNRRLTEEQFKLIQAEKLSSIGRLAAGVAHEINNPLAGLMGCLKAMEANTLSNERRREYHGAMRDGLERIRSAVRGLLDFARQQPPERRSVDLAKVIDDAVRLMRPMLHKRGMVLAQEIQPGELTIHADPSQINQAVFNVIMNAVDASPPGGRIDISAAASDGVAVLSIVDQGPGIPEGHLSRVCDPFFTTKPEGEGTGLGLSVTLSIVKAHQGDLRFERPGAGGTRVLLTIPLAT